LFFDALVDHPVGAFEKEAGTFGQCAAMSINHWHDRIGAAEARARVAA